MCHHWIISSFVESSNISITSMTGWRWGGCGRWWGSADGKMFLAFLLFVFCICILFDDSLQMIVESSLHISTWFIWFELKFWDLGPFEAYSFRKIGANRLVKNTWIFPPLNTPPVNSLGFIHSDPLLLHVIILSGHWHPGKWGYNIRAYCWWFRNPAFTCWYGSSIPLCTTAFIQVRWLEWDFWTINRIHWDSWPAGFCLHVNVTKHIWLFGQQKTSSLPR